MTIKELQNFIKTSNMREHNIVFVNATTKVEYDYCDMYDGLIDYSDFNVEEITSRVVPIMSDNSLRRRTIESQIVVYFDKIESQIVVYFDK